MSEEKQAVDKTPGVISWNEIVTGNGEATRSFYSQLFDWTAHTMDVGPDQKYTMFMNGERPAAGLLNLAPGAGLPPMWLSYVTVEKLETAVEKAVTLGAAVRKEITELPMGRFAVIVDPQGAMIGLWEFAEGGCC